MLRNIDAKKSHTNLTYKLQHHSVPSRKSTSALAQFPNQMLFFYYNMNLIHAFREWDQTGTLLIPRNALGTLCERYVAVTIRARFFRVNT